MEERISAMAIVACISQGKEKFLILNNSGEWVFPKGHVEKGENFIETAIRELFEESGVKACDSECVGQVDEFGFFFSGENARKVIKVFGFLLSSEQSIEVNKEEGFICGTWASEDEAKEMLTHDDAKEALEKFIKVIKNKTTA